MVSQQTTKAANEKFCFECGSKISSKAEICPQCGVRQLPPPGLIGESSPSGRNRVAAAIFALLLGGLGIHNFTSAVLAKEFSTSYFAGHLFLQWSALSKVLFISR